MNYSTKTLNRKDTINKLSKADFVIDDRKTILVAKHKERKEVPEKVLHSDDRDQFLFSDIKELLEL